MELFALTIAVLTFMVLIFVTIYLIRSERNADETLKVIMNLLDNNEVVLTPLEKYSMADVEMNNDLYDNALRSMREYRPDIRILDKDSGEFREKVDAIENDINELTEKNDHDHNI